MDVSAIVLQRGAILSEPAIQVRRKGKGKQIWSLEKLENRLVDMRDLYQEWKDCEEDNPVSKNDSSVLLIELQSYYISFLSRCEKIFGGGICEELNFPEPWLFPSRSSAHH